MEPLLLFDARRAVELQGFSDRAATTTLHDATAGGSQIASIFHAAEDLANVQLFSACDYFHHLRLKPLPVTDLSALTLQHDTEILLVNGEEGNVRAGSSALSFNRLEQAHHHHRRGRHHGARTINWGKCRAEYGAGRRVSRIRGRI